MYNLWDVKTVFPALEEIKEISGIEHVEVHTAIPGEYQFSLGAAIIKHKDKWYSSWGNSFRTENDDNTVLAQKTSSDGGKSWEGYEIISRKDASRGRSHGVYFEYHGELYLFCPKAGFGLLTSLGESLDLKTEGYRLLPDGSWEYMGIVIDDCFWPMCEPIVLDSGTIIMAGLELEKRNGAIALCKNGDLTQWEVKMIPNPKGYSFWGETTVLKRDDRLLAIVRGGEGLECALVSESLDNGETWSGLEESNLPISNSKMYAGRLKSGEQYLVFNVPSKLYREVLCIATGRDYLEKIFCIRKGFEEKPKFQRINEWCYPYACEDTDEDKLYVVYSKNKEDCELAIIPLENIR